MPNSTRLPTVMLSLLTVNAMACDEEGSDEMELRGHNEAILVPEDFSTIQEAIDAAEPGERISVAGDHSGVIQVDTEGLRLVAREGATLTGSFAVSADNVAIRKWNIVSDIHNQALQANNVSGLEVRGSTLVSTGDSGDFRGMWLVGCQNCLIKNNIIEGFRQEGISVLDDSAGTRIRGNQLIENGEFGIRLFGGSSGTSIGGNHAVSAEPCAVVEDDTDGAHDIRRNSQDCGC